MAINDLGFLKNNYDKTIGMGAKAINSDFTAEIEGFEHLTLLCKQVPWAALSSAGEIEVAMPNGAAYWEFQQTKTNLQGPIAFYETVAGTIDQALVDILAGGGRFNMKVYHGVPHRHVGGKRYEGCGIVVDNPDTDWENRSQVLLISGTLFFNYFSEKIPANSNRI